MGRPKGSHLTSTGKRGAYHPTSNRSAAGRKAANKAHAMALHIPRGPNVR